jgi:hypothetical protein
MHRLRVADHPGTKLCKSAVAYAINDRLATTCRVRRRFYLLGRTRLLRVSEAGNIAGGRPGASGAGHELQLHQLVLQIDQLLQLQLVLEAPGQLGPTSPEQHLIVCHLP